MKNVMLVIGSLVALSLSGLLLVRFADQNQTMSNDNPSPRTSTGQPSLTTQDPAKNGGEYLNIQRVSVADAANDEIYLFFHAPWCPQCRSIETGINSDGVPDGVTIIKVDYDSNQELRKQYGVTLQTTFVKVNRSGEFISKFVAYSDPQFSSVLREYIGK